jgi:hypothetical protein
MGIAIFWACVFAILTWAAVVWPVGLVWDRRRKQIPERKPDYNKIAELERKLGLVEPQHECSRGGHGCGVGCSAPAVPEDDPDPEDYEEVRAWGQADPVRRIDYRKRADPPHRRPDTPHPQTELKYHPMDDPRLWP